MIICDQGTPAAAATATPLADDSPVQVNNTTNTITIRILAKPGAKHNSVTGYVIICVFGGDGCFLACEDFGIMFDNSFSAWVFFFLSFFFFFKLRLAHAH